MADEQRSEAELFYRFLGQLLETGEPSLSVDEAVGAFQDFQQDRDKLQSDDSATNAPGAG